MASMEQMIAGAREYLRDFPQYFETDNGPLNVLTVRLPHPLVMASSLQVYITDASTDPVVTTPTSEWTLDERNGLLKLKDQAYLGKNVLIAGYHANWFLDSDLNFYCGMSTAEVLHSMPDSSIEDLSTVEAEVTMMGGVVHALWSLAIELSLDIDVSTPEGMFIPARQRYSQVLQMLQYWQNEYQSKAAMLNIGLGALEVFRLRRVAYMTGRYVPVYRDREIDDPRHPDRLWPPIPYGAPTVRPAVAEIAEHTVEETYRSGQEIGWTSVGTRGDYP